MWIPIFFAIGVCGVRTIKPPSTTAATMVFTRYVNPFFSFLRFIIYSMNENKSATPNVSTIAPYPTFVPTIILAYIASIVGIQ